MTLMTWEDPYSGEQTVHWLSGSDVKNKEKTVTS